MYIYNLIENRLTAVRGGELWGWIKKGEVIKQKKPPKLINTDDDSTVITRGRGRALRGVNGDGRRRDVGWRTHSAGHRWCVIELYAEPCIILLTSHPSKFN